MWTKKGHLTGQKKPFKLEDIWRIRTRLEIEGNIMELALLNLAIDCKLRSCDLLRMKVRDISSGGVIQERVLYSQSKTGREVQFEITSRTAQSLAQWLMHRKLTASDYIFPSPRRQGKSMSYSNYATIIRRWVTELGYDPYLYGTHSMRRTKATLIYARTKNIRAVQLLLGHVKLDNTIRYLGVEIEDALNISEGIDS
ncbi:tyrosine-type recombinase/integrase [Vibrio mediterranei]|uniref:tyrosine-type recombinase/integrase n=1 Tax=Vibrio mediterranei TaxID=689 RepID=UPI000152F9F5|nr:phage integrase family protein [Vibrionales bacterium SWAT-3]